MTTKLLFDLLFVYVSIAFRIVDPEMALSMLHKQPPKPMMMGGPGPHPGGGNFGMMQGGGQQFGQQQQQRYDAVPPPFDPMAAAGSRMDYPGAAPPAPRRDPREQRDPRGAGGGGGGARRGRSPGEDMVPPGMPSNLAATDPDKAKLIMQVLQLTDEQISKLPRDQQASIMELKKQLNTPMK